MECRPQMLLERIYFGTIIVQELVNLRYTCNQTYFSAIICINNHFSAYTGQNDRFGHCRYIQNQGILVLSLHEDRPKAHLRTFLVAQQLDCYKNGNTVTTAYSLSGSRQAVQISDDKIRSQFMRSLSRYEMARLSSRLMDSDSSLFRKLFEA